MTNERKLCGCSQTQRMLFHHIQIFAHKTKTLEDYKILEEDLNKLAQMGHYDPFSGGMRFLEPKAHSARVAEGKEAWSAIRRKNGRPETIGGDHDLVEQLIVGLGWRVTATYKGPKTSSFLVTSSDPRGVKICITAKSTGESHTGSSSEPYQHFDVSNIDRFMAAHNQRQGIAVLGFEVSSGEISNILDRYKRHHPKLLVSGSVQQYTDNRKVTKECDTSVEVSTIELGTMRILEVYAYYTDQQKTEADKGTVLRFIERTGTFAESPGFSNPEGVLPGLVDADPRFDGTSIPAYADHWVSNVLDREGFLATVHDVLGFEPKVDFNAGVIAAGKARIESTVVGNTSASVLFAELEALRDQSQIFLPVNNALSPAGHVHNFLKEIGQGVQHVASRVEDLVSFVERVNNYRGVTGGGFSFLAIPRSYYGVITVKFMVEQGVPQDLAELVLEALGKEGLADAAGIVDLGITGGRIARVALPTAEARAALEAHLTVVKQAVKRGRYSNLWSLLRDRLTEEEYIHTVQNQILVDIQGEDILFQIFTANILQESPEHEAPFLEFIQRVCKKRNGGEPTRPGCGGFGIRNFLTLFLSIELAKAMSDRRRCADVGDKAGEAQAQRRMQLFSTQLEESNPILTAIADAMRAEGEALERLAAPEGFVDLSEREGVAAAAEAARLEKERWTTQLQELSQRYNQLMGETLSA